MKILVTGGAGFIGSAFVRLAVERGFEVSVLDRLTYAGDLRRLEEVKDRIRLYIANICSKERVEEIFNRERPDVVVHFAAETHVDRSILSPKVFLRTNIEGTHTLLEASRKHKLSLFINISTDEVYGEIVEGEFTEESPLLPNSPYSVSKACQDMLGRAYYRTYRVPVITVRPSNNYGPWQFPEKLIPVTIIRAVEDKPVPVYGDGMNRREWLYVDDCAQAIIEILERGKVGEIYNVGSGFEMSNIEVVRAILNLLGKPQSLIEFIRDRPGHDLRYCLSTEKIRREIGWKASTGFEEGLERTVKWYLEKIDWVKEKISKLKRYWRRVYGSL